MAVSSSEECQSVDSLVVLPGGGTAKPEYESQLNIVRRMEDFNTMKSDVCLTTKSNLENANLKIHKPNNYAPCILDVDIEKGKSENPNPNDESVEHLKTNDCFARTLQREISLLTGGKFMQMNHSSELPKFTSRDKILTERVYDTLTNRSRNYKRSTSFNSRRVVLLFSVLSILGTIILIYLTMRMWLIGDGSVNHAPNEEDEELPRLFDRLARISEKRGDDISLHITFSKGKEIANCCGKGKGSE